MFLKAPSSLEQLLENNIREKEQCLGEIQKSKEQARELLKTSSNALINAVGLSLDTEDPR